MEVTAGTNPAAASVLYISHGVVIYLDTEREHEVKGLLLLIRRENETYLSWFPTVANTEISRLYVNDEIAYNHNFHPFFGYRSDLVPFITQNIYRSGIRDTKEYKKAEELSLRFEKSVFCFKLSQLHSIQKNISANACAAIELIFTERIFLPNFYFPNNLWGLTEMIRFISPHTSRDRSSPQLYVFGGARYPLYAPTASPHERNFVHAGQTPGLKSRAIPNVPPKSGVSPNSLGVPGTGRWKILESFSIITKFAEDTLQAVGADVPAASRSIDGLNLSSYPDPKVRPGASTFLFDALYDRPPTSNHQPQPQSQSQSNQVHRASFPFSQQNRDSASSFGTINSSSSGGGSTTLSSTPTDLTDTSPLARMSPAILRSILCQERVKRTPHLNILPPLTLSGWKAYIDDQTGQITSPSALKTHIFYHGLSSEARCQVWKYLVGIYDWNSTQSEREQVKKDQIRCYRLYKMQWHSITFDQETRFSKFRERRSLIDKDVQRTDRDVDLYKQDANPNLDLLREILITYSFYNFDLGYAQGMSDYASLLLYVMREETDTFWAFAKQMDIKERLFHEEQDQVQEEMQKLIDLLRFCDFELYEYFQAYGCGDNGLVLNDFCYRWVMIDLKRELTFFETIFLWERLWANPFSKKFIHFVDLALIVSRRSEILENKLEHEDILRLFLKTSTIGRQASDTMAKLEQTTTNYEATKTSPFLDNILSIATHLFLHCRNDPFFPAHLQEYYLHDHPPPPNSR